MAQLLFLGRLEDVAGTAEMYLPLAGATSLEAVIEQLPLPLAEALGGATIRLAVNGELVGASRRPAALIISDADEVAFLPPVSGG